MQYALTDIEKAASGDMKANLATLHKLNKALQPVTFATSNAFTLADIALLSALQGRIANWTIDERVALVSICRWYDNVQHLTSISPTLPSDYKVEFVLDLPKAAPKAAPAAAAPKGDGAKKQKADAAAAPSGADAKKADGEKKGAEKKEKKPAAAPAEATAAPSAAPGANADAELHRVDFRVGKIVECEKHPEADSLYVEKIDLGEPTGPRTIVSGLVKFVPLDQMLNRLVVVVANLKPAKLKGIMSAGMVLAASNADHTQVEILDPPAGAVPGERVTFAGVTGEPDAQLNPKKKIFEEVKPHLHTNAEKVAQYKELTFTTSAGPCTVATLANATLG